MMVHCGVALSDISWQLSPFEWIMLYNNMSYTTHNIVQELQTTERVDCGQRAEDYVYADVDDAGAGWNMGRLPVEVLCEPFFWLAGVGATLARDVPFSAVYWGVLEPMRKSVLPSDGTHATPARTIGANIVAGALAGGVASAITQPLVNCLKTHGDKINDNVMECADTIVPRVVSKISYLQSEYTREVSSSTAWLGCLIANTSGYGMTCCKIGLSTLLDIWGVSSSVLQLQE